jgi:hypothetical protein
MKETNYEINQGDGFQLSLTYQTASTSASPSVPFNLTGSSVVFQVRDQPGGTYVAASGVGYAASPVLGAPVDMTNAASGVIGINITGAMTSAFNTPRSAYQIKLTQASSALPVTLLQGWFKVNPSVIQ